MIYRYVLHQGIPGIYLVNPHIYRHSSAKEDRSILTGMSKGKRVQVRPGFWAKVLEDHFSNRGLSPKQLKDHFSYKKRQINESNEGHKECQEQ